MILITLIIIPKRGRGAEDRGPISQSERRETLGFDPSGLLLARGELPQTKKSARSSQLEILKCASSNYILSIIIL